MILRIDGGHPVIRFTSLPSPASRRLSSANLFAQGVNLPGGTGGAGRPFGEAGRRAAQHPAAARRGRSTHVQADTRQIELPFGFHQYAGDLP